MVAFRARSLAPLERTRGLRDDAIKSQVTFQARSPWVSLTAVRAVLDGTLGHRKWLGTWKGYVRWLKRLG